MGGPEDGVNAVVALYPSVTTCWGDTVMSAMSTVSDVHHPPVIHIYAVNFNVLTHYKSDGEYDYARALSFQP